MVESHDKANKIPSCFKRFLYALEYFCNQLHTCTKYFRVSMYIFKSISDFIDITTIVVPSYKVDEISKSFV